MKGRAGDLWSGKPTITVAVRVRPPNVKEKRSSKEVLNVLERKVVVVKDPAFESADFLRVNRARDRRYAFDFAFGPGCNQQVVYDNTTKFLIDGVLAGYNATVFAYGATGAGKTYTMLGNPRNPGIMILTLQDLYDKIEEMEAQDNVEFKVTLTYVEIYNEQIRDLFRPQSGYKDLREDPVKGPQVANVTELEATSPSEVMELLAQGNRFRTQESTAANQESSRSHAILQILVQQKERMGTDVKIGKLSLIDLAGSERASRTKNRGQRLVEGANINRSLLALGNVITALASGKKGSYINFRDSKLTRMLKDSLGGNCRTVMITNVSPAESSFEETVNTLKYANRAKNIKTKVSRNVTNVNYHISEYEHLISGLREEIANLKEQVAEAKSSTGGSGKYFPEEERELTPEEEEELQKLRKALAANFRTRQGLLGRQIELQAANVQLNVEISKRRLQKARYAQAIRMRRASSVQASRDAGYGAEETEKKLTEDDEEDQDISEAVRLEGECASLEEDIVDNNSEKEDLKKILRDNESQAVTIRQKLEALMTNQERRDVLRMAYRVYALKIQKMQLQHTNLLHEQLMKQRDLDLQSLRLQLEARDRVISQAQALLGSVGYPNALDLTEIEEVDDTMAAFEAKGRVQEEVIAANSSEGTDAFKKEEMPMTSLQAMYGGTLGRGGDTERLLLGGNTSPILAEHKAEGRQAKVAPASAAAAAGGAGHRRGRSAFESAGDEWEDGLYLPPVSNEGKKKASPPPTQQHPSNGHQRYRSQREQGRQGIAMNQEKRAVMEAKQGSGSDQPLESRSDGLRPRQAPPSAPEIAKAFSVDALADKEGRSGGGGSRRHRGRRKPAVMAPTQARRAARRIVSKKRGSGGGGRNSSSPSSRNHRPRYGFAGGRERHASEPIGVNVSDVEVEDPPTPRKSPINFQQKQEEGGYAGRYGTYYRSGNDSGQSDPEVVEEVSPTNVEINRRRPRMAAADVGARREYEGPGAVRGMEGVELIGEGMKGYREQHITESMVVAHRRISGAVKDVQSSAQQLRGGGRRQEERHSGGGRLKNAGNEVVRSRSGESVSSEPPSVVGRAVRSRNP